MEKKEKSLVSITYDDGRLNAIKRIKKKKLKKEAKQQKKQNQLVAYIYVSQLFQRTLPS